MGSSPFRSTETPVGQRPLAHLRPQGVSETRGFEAVVTTELGRRTGGASGTEATPGTGPGRSEAPRARGVSFSSSRRPGKPTAWLGHRHRRRPAMVLGWLLLLVMVLAPSTMGVQDCVFCERPTPQAVRAPACAAAATRTASRAWWPLASAPSSIKAACHASCGHGEPINYMGVTYSLTTSCCSGRMVRGPRARAAGWRGPLPAWRWVCCCCCGTCVTGLEGRAWG